MLGRRKEKKEERKKNRHEKGKRKRRRRRRRDRRKGGGESRGVGKWNVGKEKRHEREEVEHWKEGHCLYINIQKIERKKCE